MRDNLDLLLIEPSLDWEKSLKIKMSMRIEKDKPVREGLKISTGYIISSVKAAGLKVKFIDMIIEKVGLNELFTIIEENNPMVIGMPCFTFQVPVAIEIFSKIKKKFSNIILCIGGCHVSSLPKKTLSDYPYVDFVISGEAETSMPIVLNRIKSGLDISSIYGVFTRGSEKDNEYYYEDVDNLPFPDWSEFKIKNYAGCLPHIGSVELPLITGRGCPFKCIFCCRQSGSVCRRRTVDSVIEEIKRNVKDFGCDTITFLDETFVLNKKWINQFMETMHSSGLSKKIQWSCTTRVSSVSLDLLKEMKKAGCYYIFYGFESANKAVLKIIKKGITPNQMRTAAEWSRQSGIIPTGSFIIGLPGDNRESVLETIEFAKNLNLYSTTFPIATPFPGTELREMAEKGEYGMKIISDDWGEYLANDFDTYDKGKIGHLISDDLSWGERIELQRFAYNKNPKKKLREYIDALNKNIRSYNNG